MPQFKLTKISKEEENLKCSLCKQFEPYTDFLKKVNETYDNIINELVTKNKFICLSCVEKVKKIGNLYNEL
tara:strand:- start:2813 stop:3025 length:213 start_codon:yes stop_codon:yes gene_type:complete